jgi:hypothetical protein
VLAREFGDFRYARFHRLTVDTYSLQHPRDYMRSGKSFAAHLRGMCAALERDDASVVNRAVRAWLDGPRVIDSPEAPAPRRRGPLTIAHVHGARDAGKHVERVGEWARATWVAWEGWHDLARRWIDLATTPRR